MLDKVKKKNQNRNSRPESQVFPSNKSLDPVDLHIQTIPKHKNRSIVESKTTLDKKFDRAELEDQGGESDGFEEDEELKSSSKEYGELKVREHSRFP